MNLRHNSASLTVPMVLNLGKNMGQGPTVLYIQRTQDSRNLCPHLLSGQFVHTDPVCIEVLMKRVSWQSGAKEYLKVTANKPNHFKKSHVPHHHSND